MKNKKTAMLKSLLAMLLCIAMLVGNTFAWFTDNVSSTENIIKAGKLDIEMYWTDDLNSGVWHNVDDAGYNTIFSYEKWEPGYTDVKYIKLVNKGNLAFNYKLTLTPQGSIGKLAEVINVYFADSAVAMNERVDLSNLGAIGLLSNVVGGGATASGTLLASTQSSPLHPSGEVIMTIAMSMITTAGNQYQTESSGDFTVTALATQAPFEEDAFGAGYDTNSEYDLILNSTSLTASVTPDNGLVPAGGVTMSGNGISAFVPAGAKMADGADKLKLTITPLESTASGITAVNDEIIIPVDVHVDGLADDNTTPVVIDLGPVLPKYLNMGNYHLYHVEDGANAVMTLVDEREELTAHNRYTYDPVTGEVTVAMASFSEVAMLADTDNEWEGEYDYSWYTNSKAKTETADYFIANADQLAAFGKIVGGMADGFERDSFAGKTVKLLANINLGDGENKNNSNVIFHPIGYYYKNGDSTVKSFEGTFDGNGNTVSNFYQNTWEIKGDYDGTYYKDAMGLFGYVYGGTVKNLTVANFSSDGEFTPTGVIAAYADGDSTFENIAITNCNPRVYNTGNGGIIGIAGDTSTADDDHIILKNITVDNSNKISALWGSWDVACGGLVGMYRGNVDGSGNATGDTISFENCHVSAQIDVYNDVCANYQYYAYRYAGMIIGSVRHNTTVDGKIIPNTTGITANNSTVNFGEWNDYYYCELVANTLASYTHDHQFSRLLEIKAIDGTTVTLLDGTTTTVPATGKANYVVVNSEGHGTENATCYHFVEGKVWNHADAGTETVNGVEVLKEDNQHIYLEFKNLFTGYGWGVNTYNLETLTAYPGFEVSGITEGEKDKSVVKFDVVLKDDSIESETTLTLGEIFSAVEGVDIDSANVNVFVSPAEEGSTVSGIFTADTSGWTNGTLTFNGTGKAKITISDYNFCKETTVTVTITERTAKDKFTANSNLNFTHTVEGGTIYKTLGDIFTAVEGANINSANVTVTVDDTICTYEQNVVDWTESTLAFKGVGTVTITITDGDYCKDATAEVNIFHSEYISKFASKFTGGFLYRVGNANPVALDSLFAALPDVDINSANVDVKVETVQGNASGKYTPNATWTNGTIEFSGTGIVKITITDKNYCIPTELLLEVVDATNVPENGKITNYNVSSVLLGNTSVSTLYLNGGATLYGNGFTIDCKNSPVNGSGSVSENYIIGLVDAHLDNVKVVGKVYTEYGAQAANNYNRALVVSKGDSTITNCYLSNTASPIRLVEGSLYVKGTTVKGGNFANIDVRNGHLIVEDVTTINQALGNDKADNGSTVIGLGIVVYYENVDTALTSVTVKGTLTQYNHISSNATFTHEYATQLVEEMMSSTYADFQTTVNGVTWVMPGIIEMTKLEERNGYEGKDIRFYARDGYVYAVKPTEDSIIAQSEEYVTLGQGTIAPAYSFDYINKNYQQKVDGSNDYCYYENGKVLISMDQGDTFQWDPFILTATKYGQILNYTVAMNGSTYTSGQKINFNTTGDYVVTYTYTDDNNYIIDPNGDIVTRNVTYTKTVNINVSVIKPTTKHATFTFADTNTATETITVGDKTYISAKGVSATDKEWGYITVSGTKIFYPITEAQMKTSSKLLGGKETQVYYYVFKDAVTIKDYKDGGTGDEQIYNADTKSMPSNLTVVNGMEAKYTSIASACVDVSKLTKKGSDGEVWDFSASTTVSGTTTYNDYLAHSSPSGLTVKDGTRDYDAITVAQFSYTDAAGATYYYFVGYFMENQNTSNSGGSSGTNPCVTPDTLVTLADGTQKRIDEVSYSDKLLVWNFYEGKYDVAPIAIIFDHGADNNTVIKLTFSDGTVVKVVNMHQFYNADLNSFVTINEDTVADYIGHKFAQYSGNGNAFVELVDYEISYEYVEAWGIMTAGHYNIITSGMLSADFDLKDIDLFTYFEADQNMTYDASKIQADIDEYGLYTYEDFADYLTYEQFVAFNVQYFKIPVGKGLYTYEGILELIDYYLN